VCTVVHKESKSWRKTYCKACTGSILTKCQIKRSEELVVQEKNKLRRGSRGESFNRVEFVEYFINRREISIEKEEGSFQTVRSRRVAQRLFVESFGTSWFKVFEVLSNGDRRSSQAMN
jgi:hypothetical protein